MQEWVDNPRAETALSNILPCDDELATNHTLFESRKVVSILVNTVNTFIYTAANTDRPPSDQFYYNQSGPVMPPLCYPFDDKMQDRECLPHEVSMTNASMVCMLGSVCLLFFLFFSSLVPSSLLLFFFLIILLLAVSFILNVCDTRVKFSMRKCLGWQEKACTSTTVWTHLCSLPYVTCKVHI